MFLRNAHIASHINNIWRAGRFFVLLLFLATLAACVVIDHAPYPGRWGDRPPIANTSCTDISGSFNVLGESASGDRDKTSSLIRFFWSDFNQIQWAASRMGDATHVTIEQNVDTVTISAWTNTRRIAQREFKKSENDYLCTAEGVSARGVGPSVHGLAGYIGQKVTLFKVDDGNLVVKVDESGGGLALVIPAYGSTTYWKRYRPYPNP